MLHLHLQSFASIVLYLHVKRMHSCWRRTAGKEEWSLCYTLPKVMNWSGLEKDPGRFLVGGDLGVKDWVSVLHDVGIDVELVEDDVLCFLKQN